MQALRAVSFISAVNIKEREVAGWGGWMLAMNFYAFSLKGGVGLEDLLHLGGEHSGGHGSSYVGSWPAQKV